MRTTLTTEMYIFCVCVVWLSDTAWREEHIQHQQILHVQCKQTYTILNTPLLPKLNTDLSTNYFIEKLP